MKELIPIDKRNLLYKKAKELYIERIKKDKDPEFGLCWAIREATILMGYGEYSVNSDEFKNLFPELMKCKPKRAPQYGFWWKRKMTKVRLKYFSLMIEETGNK